MNEIELNTLFDIVSDPVKNVYTTDTIKKKNDLLSVIKVFSIAKSQRNDCSTIAARGLVAFKMLVSNN